MPEEFSPALTTAEWTGVLAQEDQLREIRAAIVGLPFSSHAMAALFLFREPFGFSAQDLVDERDVAAYCDAMAIKNEELGDAVTAQSFRELGVRHRERAAKIAALLPPLSLLATLPPPGFPPAA